MPNAENLKGHSFRDNPERINRKGRPKRLPELDQLIIELLGEKGGESRMRELLASLIELAIGGNIRAADLILTRAYGKPKEHVDVTSNGESMRQKTTIIFSDDSEPKIIPSPDGTFRDERGNTIGTIDPKHMDMFGFQIVFKGGQGDNGRVSSLPPELMTDDEIQGDDGKRSFVGF